MKALTPDERAALNALTLNGQLAAARCVERLLMDGETVLSVLIAGARVRVEILPPHPSSPLWREAASCRLTHAEATFVNVRFGCEVRWTVSRAEAELRRVFDGAPRMH